MKTKIIKVMGEHRGLLSAINEHLLVNGYEREDYNKALFDECLSNPTFCHNQFTKEFRDKTSFHSSGWKDFVQYKPATISNPNLNTVYDEYLAAILKEDADVKRYGEYFNPNHLQGILVTNIALGGQSLDQYREFFGEARATEFENKKNLEITRKNKRCFKKDDQVELFLKIKNISELVLKVYEVDTETYYKRNKTEISDSLDLDGLIPEEVYKYCYNQKKQHEHEEVISCPTITAKRFGVFIMEFVGGGISSRAVIRKGALKHLTQRHFQGTKVYIIDEDKQICTGNKTGLFIEGKFHQVNDQGFVLLPFHDNSRVEQVILTHDGFCNLEHLSIDSENYDFNTAVLFNEESLVSGRKLKLIVKNKLLLNGMPITLKKIKEYNAEVQLQNYDGVTNYKHFKDLQLSDSEDVTLDLIVPQMLTQVRINISAKAKTLLGKDVNLSASESISIFRNEGTSIFACCQLDRSDELGYYIQIRGKNGEPIPHQQVLIDIQKLIGGFSFTKELFTDQKGQCVLGQLQDVNSLSVYSGNNFFNGRAYLLNRAGGRSSCSTTLNVCPDEVIVLPRHGREVVPSNFHLLRLTSSGQPLSDCFENLKQDEESGELAISDLNIGQYQLFNSEDPSEAVYINVHEGSR